MVGKVSERVLLREGLERTDNGMKLTSWPEVAAINQKNYYTDYMKRDDQVLALRVQNDANRDKLVQSAKDRDRALSKQPNGELPLPVPDLAPEDEGAATPAAAIDPSKIIVIHPGSQNLRIGFASDALPRTVPMVLATKFPQTESEMYEALPRRHFEAKTTEAQYGEEWSRKYQKMCGDLKVDMRANKRKVLPNSKELVQTYNRRTEAEIIQKHNDPLEVEWTDVKKLEDPESLASCFIGNEALRIPDDSSPKFKLWWPIQSGWWNEDGYNSKEHLFDDFETLLDNALRQELGLRRNSQWKQYSCVFVIPDLYDKQYVEQALRSCMSWFEFSKVSFVQESMAATFGAGYTQACVVDVGAQKTSVTCVEDGLCLEDSRVNLKYGGYDITDTFLKMMLYDNFPYQDINLRRRYDFLLAEELKMRHCTMSQADISVQLYQFHIRAPNRPTAKYHFKTYDEVILAPSGVFDPTIFDNSTKLRGRRTLVPRSYNAYDIDMPDDPTSAAQLAVLKMVDPSVTTTSTSNGGPSQQLSGGGGGGGDVSTPVKDRSQPFSFSVRGGGDSSATPMGSHAGSPAPEGAGTPVPAPFVFGSGNSNRDATNGGSPAPTGSRAAGTPVPGQNGSGSNNGNQASQQAPAGLFVDSAARTAEMVAAKRDSVLPAIPLDVAILTSIETAARGDEKKLRDFLGSIMVIGGGAKVPHFTVVLEEKLKQRRPDLVERILVSRSARDMDEQVVTWKGASVFAKLPTNDSWITPYEFERHGSRTLHHKVLWSW
ncbi:actin-related protein 8 [Geosmithia morbida]|uniref:Actin-related protein 8 n=1 Tax=Geosmithia morbida TaxID=1094350 RepID=A0A9P4YT23_9HYPO|nr:actin-related protein 8 [Geosmithia morbida]KAF4121136.1 actin-related protein 8 [Geosmithia morbida]